jgi:CRISPR/Cas system-associated exonuclease Cas4 (RecB family)
MPVRRLHNFIYCPRLFYFQWVENIFQENADTVAGSHIHRNVDTPSKLEDPQELGLPEGAKIRSLRLKSESLGLIGVVDIVEGGPDGAEIIDYKKGSARRNPEGEREVKEPDAIQVAAHALLLREQGVNVARGAVYYAAEKRRVPVELFELPGVRLQLAREVIRAKIHNQRVMLMRNGDAPDRVLSLLVGFRDATERATDMTGLLGIEGNAAALYFEHFESMLKQRESWHFDWRGRNRRPPRDPVNALLSLGYSMLAKELTGICHAVGLDPFLGFMHQPRYGRPALALDLMEEFRPLTADSVAISRIA